MQVYIASCLVCVCACVHVSEGGWVHVCACMRVCVCVDFRKGASSFHAIIKSIFSLCCTLMIMS